MKQPRILYTSYYGDLGGGELRLLDHVRYSAFSYKSFTIILFKDGELGEKLRELGIPVEIIEWSTKRKTHLYDVNTFLKLTRFLLKNKPDLMICNTYNDLIMAGAAAVCLRIPVIWRSRADVFPFFYLKNHLRKKVLLNFLKRRVKRILCTTNYDKKLILDQGIPEGKVFTVYNGVDSEVFEKAGTARSTIRNEFGVADTEVLIGFVARMVPQKGHIDFFEALAKVKQKIRNVKALVIGDITLNYDDPEYKDFLKAKVRSLGLGDCVHLTGFREDIPAIMNATDIFVSASLKEPFGTTTIEAMCAGKPVVATNTAGSLEIVENGSTGILVPIKDVDAMAGSISYLIENPLKAYEMGRSGREKVRRVYDLRANVRKLDRHCWESIGL